MRARHHSRLFAWLVVACAILVCTARASAQASGLLGDPALSIPQESLRPATRSFTDETTARLQRAYGRLPLSFEANRGQTDARVEFLSRGSGYTLFLTRRGDAVLALRSSAPERDPLLRTTGAEEQELQAVLRMKIVGANRRPRSEGAAELPAKANFLIGSNPRKWRTNVPTYAQVRYRAVYPGVDLVYYGNQRQLEYDFVVAPGADPRSIAIGFDGADKISLDASGDLILATRHGEVRFRKPFSYQEANGVRSEVSSRYVRKGPRRVGFQIAGYDRGRPLVIDPVLVYSTYLGGSDRDQGTGIAVDSTGHAYVAGRAFSTDFPTTSGAFQTTNPGSSSAFVAKLTPDGSALIYSTFIGGSAAENGNDVAVDGAGNAYVEGSTSSADFPTTPGAFDTTHNGSVDAFLTKLNPTGTGLVYSTFLGGSGLDAGQEDLALDASGNAYLTGFTTSTDFPTTPLAFQATYGGGPFDAFVTKLNASGTALVYSTYLGGFGDEWGIDIAVDGSDSAYVTGFTSSSNFPTTAGAFDTSLNGFRDVFVTKMNPTGTGLVYSTFLGSGTGNTIAVDAGGNAYVAGQMGFGFPTTPLAFQTSEAGGGDAFVTKVNSTGTGLVYSTYLGGGGLDDAIGIALDAGDNAYVTGVTQSTNFPTTADAIQPNSSDGQDVFVTKLNPTGSAPLLFSTYLGGFSDDRPFAIAVDSLGAAYVTGQTSEGFPTTPGAFDPSPNGNNDTFVAKIEILRPPATLALSPPSATNVVGAQHCVTATVEDASGSPIPGITVRFSVTGTNAASVSSATDGGGQATFCYTGTTTGADAIHAYADTDGDNTEDSGEAFDDATKTWTSGPPATVTLSPATATNTVDTPHCVTATVQDEFGNPSPNVQVRFSVTFENSELARVGSLTTDAIGQATFCYPGSELPGSDAIVAFADMDGDHVRTEGEPSATAEKIWVLPATTPRCEIKITNSSWILAANQDRASFSGDVRSLADGSTQGQTEYFDEGPAQRMKLRSINIQAIVCDGSTAASIYGQATIDGAGSIAYRIRVKDLGKPGRARDTYGILLANGYGSGEQPLEAGNVQIRRD